LISGSPIVEAHVVEVLESMKNDDRSLLDQAKRVRPS
jgi:hypothetical protein